METLEEAKNIYGDVPLKFTSYYKFSFTFAGEAGDGAEVIASVGGDSTDIYKMPVNADDVETLNSLDPSSVRIIHKGKTIFEWNNY